MTVITAWSMPAWVISTLTGSAPLYEKLMFPFLDLKEGFSDRENEILRFAALKSLIQLSPLDNSGSTPSRGFSMLYSRLNVPPSLG